MNTFQKKLDLMYHPVRIRIIRLLSLKTLTTKEIGDELSDVPTGTLYRQVKLLYDGHFLEVVKTVPKRGTVEKYFRLKKGSTDVKASDSATLSIDTLITQFRFFTESINNDYIQYLETRSHSKEPHPISYNQYILNLTVEERNEFYRKLIELLDEFDHRDKKEGQKAWLVSSIVIPTLELK